MQTPLKHAEKLTHDVPGLLLAAETVARTFLQGAHGRRRAGQGESFWQFRPWSPGDQRRDIDWKQTARREDVFVRQYEWEAAQTLYLWRDSSTSMNFYSHHNGQSKRYYAEVLTLALSIVALEGGERVGLLGTGLPPQTRMQSIRRIADAMTEQKSLYNKSVVSSRGQIVLFSDFYFDLEEFSAQCAEWAVRHIKGVIVKITDPAERDFPYTGRIRFQDLEEASAYIVFPEAEAVQEQYKRKFREHTQQLEKIAHGHGWDFFDFSTDTDMSVLVETLYQRIGVHW